MLIPKDVCNVAKVAARDETRYAIHGVSLERDVEGKPWAVATDGRRLIAATWTEDPGEEYPAGAGDVSHVSGFKALVPSKDFRDAGKLAAKGRIVKARPILGNVLVDEKATAANGIVPMAGMPDVGSVRTAAPGKLKGTFPQWEAVVPEYDGGESVSAVVNPTLLAGLLDVLAKVDPGREPTVRLTIPRESGRPVRLDTVGTGTVDAKAVLMPITLET